jgi:23S rRNA pseudouridine1911/1915/1917 synthase
MKITFKALKSYRSLNTFLEAKGFSKSLVSFYKNNNHLIKINQESVNTLTPIIKKDFIEIELPKETNAIPLIDKPLNIIYEDPFVMVINKPENLASSPTRAHILNNVSGMIANHFNSKNINSKIHLVNRLDKETRGLMLVAKHQYFHALLSRAKIIKKYRLVAKGKIKQKRGIIEKTIAKSQDSNRRIETKNGDLSITKYEVKSFKNNLSYIEAQLITGRTHQLRLHFSLIGNPIVGDPLYGDGGKTLHLQSFYIKFKHPVYNKILSFKLKREW